MLMDDEDDESAVGESERRPLLLGKVPLSRGSRYTGREIFLLQQLISENNLILSNIVIFHIHKKGSKVIDRLLRHLISQ